MYMFVAFCTEFTVDVSGLSVKFLSQRMCFEAFGIFTHNFIHRGKVNDDNNNDDDDDNNKDKKKKKK